MHVTLPPDLEPFVDRELAAGRYTSGEQLVVHALRWFKAEREQAVAGIKEGLVDAAVGRTQPLSEALADIRKEFGVPDPE